MKRFALTAVGKDKPGIVATVTRTLYEHGLNIEDSSMTILQDEFAIILIMTADDSININKLREALNSNQSEMALTIHLKELSTSEPPRAPSNHFLTIYGADKPGIVFKTAEALSELSINITDLETKKTKGESGDLYIMVMEVSLPQTLGTERAKEKLEEIGKALGVNATIKEIESYDDI